MIMRFLDIWEVAFGHFEGFEHILAFVLKQIADLKFSHYVFGFANFFICSSLFYLLFYWHKKSQNKVLHLVVSASSTLALAYVLEFFGGFYSSYSIKLLVVYFIFQVILSWFFDYLLKKNGSEKLIKILRFDLYALLNWIFMGESGYYFIPRGTMVEKGFWEIFVLGIFVIFVISLLMLRRIIRDTIENKEGVIVKKLLKIFYSSIWLFVGLFILNWISAVSFFDKLEMSLESFVLFIVIHVGVWILKVVWKNSIEGNVDSKYHHQQWDSYRFFKFLLKMTVNPTIAILTARIWGYDIPGFFVQLIGLRMMKKIFIIIAVLIVLKIMFIFCESLVRFIVHSRKRGKEMSSRVETLITVINIFLKIIIVMFGLFCLLYLLGTNPMPLFANFWILTAGLSIGLQTLMKDLAVGIIMMFEDTFHIGDDVEVAGISGEIEDITLRVLKIRSDVDGALVSIPFNRVEMVSNKSRQFMVATFTIYVEPDSDFSLVSHIMEEAGHNLAKTAEFKHKILQDIKVFGPLSVSSVGAKFEGKLRIVPMSMRSLRSVFYTLCQQEFEANNIRFAQDLGELKKLFL